MTEELKTIDTVDTSPFKKMVMTIGELPTSFVDSMTYYELLAWLCNYLQGTVIPAVNNNGEAVSELQQLYVELKSYVDNYFDNLDVQEEINNKLDAMAEAGTLQEIIGEYLNATAVWGFDTVASMKSGTNLVNGSFARTLGFYAKNDGGAALYKIRTITNDDVVDETKIFEMDGDNDLIAELIVDESMNVKQFGVKADGTTDNTAKLNIILGYGYYTLYFPDGEYLINSRLDISSIKKLHGESKLRTIIKAPNGLTWSNNSSREFYSFTLDGVEINQETTNTGLEGILAFGKIENVCIKNYEIAFKPLTGSWLNNFDNFLIDYCTNGVYNPSITTFNDNTFLNCVFQHITNDCVNAKGDVNNFIGCDWEFSHYCFNRAGRLLNIDKCYIEGNDRIINVNETSYPSNVTIKNSWLYSKGANATNGWIACMVKVTNADSQTASLLITDCEIHNKVADTLKPFSFQGDGQESYWGVSLENNSYFEITTAHPYLVYYVDLFDFTTATSYGTVQNAITFTTDLPLYNYNGLYAFRKSLGNKCAALNKNQLIELKGHYSVEQTTGLVTITPTYKLANAYPQINGIPVMVKFSDNTIDFGRMNLGSDSINISVPYNSRTTAEIIFDCSIVHSA